MATNTDYNQTGLQLVTDALMLIGRLGEGETPTTNAISFALGILNKLIKHWEALGIHLWTESEGTVFLTQGQAKYTLSSTGDHACDDSTLVETTLSSSGSGTSLSVTTSVGMTIGDNIGVVLDNNTLFWTTIATVPDTTSVTLVGPLTSSATSGNCVFSYTTTLDRPLDIFGARVRNNSSFDRMLMIYGRTEFMQIPNKVNQAPATVIYYSPQKTKGLLYVWPAPDSTVSNRIKISYLRAIQDLDAEGDNVDLPTEWLHALTYNLARMLAPSYGVNLARNDVNDILAIAGQALEELKLWDSERSSVFITPSENYDY
jgi:hypothetical protein